MVDSNPYFGVTNILRRYWHIYGGWRELFSSVYVHLSVVLCVITFNYWLNKNWWSQPLSILPNLLGFTLGGFAVFLGFGDEKFKAIIAGDTPGSNGRHSPYLGFSVSFLHFVLVQVLALLWAIMASALHIGTPKSLSSISGILQVLDTVSSAIGYWLFLYSICAAAAAAIGVFRIACLFDSFKTHERENLESKKSD